MWPFRKKSRARPNPAVKIGGTLIEWNSDYHRWEFTSDGQLWTLRENPVFNPAVLDQLPRVRQWIMDLEAKINREIAGHLEHWCEWDDVKKIVAIDVSWLIEERQAEVSYVGGEDWGDLGIDVVLIDGRVDHSDAGD